MKNSTIKLVFLILLFSFFYEEIHSQSYDVLKTLPINQLFHKYGDNITINNIKSKNPNISNCIYEMYNPKVTLNGSILILEFGFGGKNTSDVIEFEKFKIELSNTNIMTYHSWYKSIIKIINPNGIEVETSGNQSYNRGNKTAHLIDVFYLDCKTEALANRFIEAFLELQKEYKKDIPKVDVKKDSVHSSINKEKKTIKKNIKEQNKVSKKSKSGKYGE